MRIYVLFFSFLCGLSWAGTRELSGIKPIDKSPKALFLIKKARIDNDVAEPTLYPKHKQEQSLKNEKIYRKYGLSDIH